MNSYDSTWEDLCLQFYPRLSAHARRLTHGNIERAEDLVQETMVRILGCDRPSSEIQTPLAYAFTIMKNALRDQIRKSTRRQIVSLDDPLNVELQKQLPVIQPTVQRDLENKGLLKAVKLKGGRLTGREGRLLELMADGKDAGQIADIFEEDIRIIKSDCNALKAKLRYRLAKWQK